ncbi:MAG: DUF6464 family protein [Cyanobacteria bacterium J06641_5]
MSRRSYRGERLILHDFSHQELASVDFQDTILFCCDFRGAHLYRANFANATLVTCDFTSARLTEADFRVRSHRTCTFHDAWVDGIIVHPEKILGNPDCIHNAQSAFLRCAVNPLGPCEGCQNFELTS